MSTILGQSREVPEILGNPGILGQGIWIGEWGGGAISISRDDPREVHETLGSPWIPKQGRGGEYIVG